MLWSLRDKEEGMEESAFKLLSEFYIALWGELDALSDEYRWVRIVGEKETRRKAKTIFEQLKQVSPKEKLPVPIDQLKVDLEQATEFIEKFAKKWDKAEPRERKDLRKSLDEMRARFQERGLAFGTFRGT